jgi:aromatic ring hydroxylase
MNRFSATDHALLGPPLREPVESQYDSPLSQSTRTPGPVPEKYYAAAVPAERRLRILNLFADLTARDYGGYQMGLAIHAESSPEAEKMQIARSFNPARAVDYVSTLAGLGGL